MSCHLPARPPAPQAERALQVEQEAERLEKLIK